ncbi:MAG: TVP38/TMEM64 family protein [Acidobacteria bacterium]|nr:TVP38/TMEM64 family protein [Acidobacteriota bacterium]
MSRRIPVRTLLIILAALLLIVGLRKLPVAPLLNRLIEWGSGTGVMGLAVFALVYAVAAVLFLPGSVLTLGAGAAFGLFKGTVAVSVGATLGAGAAFLIGRYLARSRVARWAAENPKFAAIDAAVGREGGRIVFLTRLSPLFPYNLLNYLFGVTRVGFWSYLLASWVGMLPGTLLYVYLGFAGRTAAQATVNPGAGSGWKLVFWGVGLAATGLLTYYLTRLARRALAEKTE